MGASEVFRCLMLGEHVSKRKSNSLTRRISMRKYRDVCWVSAEGQTEKDYFSMKVFRNQSVSVKFPKDTHPSRRNPAAVLKRFQKTLGENDFRAGDEAWLVIDIDEWDKEEFVALLTWADADERYHLAISNPKFELFLLMHFEKGNGCTTAHQVDMHLKRYMPTYDKRIKADQFDIDDVMTAVSNAGTKRASCDDVLPAVGTTDAYKLVQSLLKIGDD